MEVRRILSVDKNLIRILKLAFAKGVSEGKSGEWSLESAESFVKDRNNIFLLAYVDDRIVGMLIAYKLLRMDDKKAKIFLYEVGVGEKHRNKGVGKAMIENLKQISKSMGVGEMFVLTNLSNKAAVALYKSTGGVISKNKDEIMFSYKFQK